VRSTATPSRARLSAHPATRPEHPARHHLHPSGRPLIARARLRLGNTVSAKGAGRLLAQALTTAWAACIRGKILARAAAYYGWAFVGTALRHKAWFSVTVLMTKTVTAAITAIPAEAWQPIEYPHAIYDEAEQRWVSDPMSPGPVRGVHLAPQARARALPAGRGASQAPAAARV